MDERKPHSRSLFFSLEFLVLTALLLADLAGILLLDLRHWDKVSKHADAELVLTGAVILGYVWSVKFSLVLCGAMTGWFSSLEAESATSHNGAASPTTQAALALWGAAFFLLAIGILILNVGHLLGEGGR